MPRLRRRFDNLSPAQKEAQRQFYIAETFVDVLTMGIGRQLENSYSTEKLDVVLNLIERELRPALQTMENADVKLNATLRKTRKKGPKTA